MGYFKVKKFYNKRYYFKNFTNRIPSNNTGRIIYHDILNLYIACILTKNSYSYQPNLATFQMNIEIFSQLL